MIITLCGSTKFKSEFEQIASAFTQQGHIVLMPHVFYHTEDINLTSEEIIRLENVHKQKIMMSDSIFIVNPNGYIGEGTYRDIDWADKMQKEIKFFISPEANANSSVTTIPDNESDNPVVEEVIS